MKCHYLQKSDTDHSITSQLLMHIPNIRFDGKHTVAQGFWSSPLFVGEGDVQG